MDMGNNKGMTISPPVSITIGLRDNVSGTFKTLVEKYPDLDMILVTLCNIDPLYGKLKLMLILCNFEISKQI